MADIDKLREEATRIVNKDSNRLVMRSCWNCNEAHSHMSLWEDVVIMCSLCGRYFFKGENITEEE